MNTLNTLSSRQHNPPIFYQFLMSKVNSDKNLDISGLCKTRCDLTAIMLIERRQDFLLDTNKNFIESYIHFEEEQKGLLYPPFVCIFL